MTMPLSSKLERPKRMAAARAIEEGEDGMILGLGSGSTAAFAIEALAARIAKNLRIVGRIVIGGFLPMGSQGRRSRSSGSWAALPFTCTFRCVARDPACGQHLSSACART